MIFFVANSEKCCKYTFLGGSAQIITILHRGGYQNLLQYYNGGTAPYKNLIRNADSCEIQCLSKAPQRGWD